MADLLYWIALDYTGECIYMCIYLQVHEVLKCFHLKDKICEKREKLT